ncbi:MAG: MotA/TolQ/ExbB proton channel family protein [Verrucomicrobia bacterium]|nr:MotA/TolQ/ExbB proton channel family protein [Verrucomicrobiota bacterium]
MVLLVIASVVAVGLIVERAWTLRRLVILPPAVQAAVEQCRTLQDIELVERVCRQQPSPLSRLLLLASEHRDWPRDENADSLQTQARHEVVRMERGLVVLEIVVGIAPLLGLVGTIHGLITLFGDMGKAGLGNNTEMARGVAIALNTALGGLLTAIPALIAWSSLSKKVENLAVEMELVCDEFLRRVYRTARDAGSKESRTP